LFRSFPNYNEGQKSKIKANLVSTASLAEMAEQLGLGNHMILGRGEEKTGGRRKQALLADTCEALIAAIYLDAGFAAAFAFVERFWTPLIAAMHAPPRDPKTLLQEWAQGRGLGLPNYRVAATEGPDHARHFTVAVSVAGQEEAAATASSKRAAETAAAAALLERLSLPTPAQSDGTKG
jgi:ribonuclease-3